MAQKDTRKINQLLAKAMEVEAEFDLSFQQEGRDGKNTQRLFQKLFQIDEELIDLGCFDRLNNTDMG